MVAAEVMPGAAKAITGIVSYCIKTIAGTVGCNILIIGGGRQHWWPWIITRTKSIIDNGIAQATLAKLRSTIITYK